MSGILTFYDILQVESTASQEEIKKSYQQLVLQHHPDKKNLVEPNNDDNSIFIAIDEAWKVLRDPELRHIYDVELRQADYNDKPIVHETLTKADFEYDQESNLYYHNCRCGGVYVLPDEDEEEEAQDDTKVPDQSNEDKESIYISCDECSLVIEVEINIS